MPPSHLPRPYAAIDSQTSGHPCNTICSEAGVIQKTNLEMVSICRTLHLDADISLLCRCGSGFDVSLESMSWAHCVRSKVQVVRKLASHAVDNA